jgi:hypothetical protein
LTGLFGFIFIRGGSETQNNTRRHDLIIAVVLQAARERAGNTTMKLYRNLKLWSSGSRISEKDIVFDAP